MEPFKLSVFATPDIYHEAMQDSPPPEIAEALDLVSRMMKREFSPQGDAWMCKKGRMALNIRLGTSQNEAIVLIARDIYVRDAHFSNALATSLPLSVS